MFCTWLFLKAYVAHIKSTWWRRLIVRTSRGRCQIAQVDWILASKAFLGVQCQESCGWTDLQLLLHLPLSHRVSLIWNWLDPQKTSKSCRFWHMRSQNIAAAWTSHHQQPFKTLLENEWYSVDLSTQESFPVFDSIQVISFAENLDWDTTPVVTRSAESPPSFTTQPAANWKAIIYEATADFCCCSRFDAHAVTDSDVGSRGCFCWNLAGLCWDSLQRVTGQSHTCHCLFLASWPQNLDLQTFKKTSKKWC